MQRFILYLFALLFLFSGAYGVDPGDIGDLLDMCKIVDCGQGVCNKTLLFPFFNCDCYTGWTHVDILNITVLPTCVIPNCSTNLNCALPQLPPLILPTNISDPCNFVSCGNGTCAPKSEGIGHICNCADGAYNLLNATDMPCFQECYLGSDCNNVGFGTPPPPMSPTPSGTSNTGGPAGGGSSSNSSRQWIAALAYMVFLMSFQFVF